MLKALELAGFKSFADRTRFEFPDGITVVVGPNGSGKSNIVDAMKWVLGSQSAKSLRGKDMSDVIFKGSQTRGPSGAAEATIIFDNSGGDLPVDAPEVHVTRRVYRSGEGEYLINNQAVRLKDVRNLIRGTGIGIDAYSLIEQGKVDRMLQANAKDRRAIFEEAAGISRFKAKKVEAERRLARVQQNLSRLGDIVDEVASRLRSLKSQASKADRYRRASERLEFLRTHVAWSDWRTLSEEITAAETELAAAVTRHQQAETRREAMTEQRHAAEIELQSIADDARAAETRQGDLVRRIAELDGRKSADVVAMKDQRIAVARSLRRVGLLQSQAGTAASELRGATARMARYESELRRVKDRIATAEAHRGTTEAEVASVQSVRDSVQRNHLAVVRRVADHEATRQRTQQQVSEAVRVLGNLASRADRAAGQRSEAEAEARESEATIGRIHAAIAQAAKQVEMAEAKVQESRRTLQRRRDEGSALKVRLQGVTERRGVLAELQQRQEGLSGGVRVILQQLRDASSELSPLMLGLVAETFEVDTAVAPLIDAALGPRSQYVIVQGDQIQTAISRGELVINSRVGLIRIDDLPARRPGDRIRLDGLKGVVGRGDRMIRCDEQFQPLARHLLSNTWLVDTLQTALGLRKLSGAGLRFVSADGELLENDGTVVVGPPGAAAGLVSRRSELAAAEQEIKHYQYQLQEAEAESARLAARVDEQAAELGRCEQEHRKWVTERAAAEAELRHANERLDSRQTVCDEVDAEINAVTSQRDDARREDAELVKQIRLGRQEIEVLEGEAAEADEMLAEAQTQRQDAATEVMNISVDLARVEQKYEALVATMQQQRRDRDEREAAVTDVRRQADEGRTRINDLSTRILQANSHLATLHWDVEQAAGGLKELARKAAHLRAESRRTVAATDAATQDASQASQAVHAITAKRDNALLRRETLADRMLEDYQIDLRTGEPPENLGTARTDGLQPSGGDESDEATDDGDPVAFSPNDVAIDLDDREAIDAEIATLRGQLQKTGSVNMEALEELSELQTRYDELHGQYQDLTAAKDSLQRIIARINADSRRLFLDTLEAIRQNFQKLYRKSFGGGTADLVLEDSDDPLEAGVEIVATPPGKPSFNNSLLSGGEKALTAVALLMSIFQYRPSPFCVLDEVDAPFDEANIGRFVTVLTEFLDQSKFVVVTHSKKTMTAATTLYGVTMQESGVSKQVSIRFEDVSEDGEISTDGEAA